MLDQFRGLLKNKDFKLLWISQILSQITINTMNFVLLLKLFEKTESTVATSFLWVAYALPALIFGPIGAVAVDIFERRKMLMITNFLQALVILIYSFFHASRVFLLYSIVMAYSLFNQFYVPAEAASLPSVVSKKDLPSSNGLFFLTQQFSLVFGFGIAGFLYKFLGSTYTFYLCSFFLFLAFLSVSFLPDLKVPEENRGKVEKNFGLFFERILEGYKFIKGNTSILIPLLLLLACQVGLNVLMVIIPLIATDVLKIGLELSGIALVAPAGLGAGLGAILIPKLISGGMRKRKIIEYSLILASVCFFSLIFLFAIDSMVLRLIVSTLIIVISGLSFIGIVIPSQTYIQDVTPNGMRGRVFGNFWFLVTIISIFPVIFSGAVAEALSIRALILVLSATTLGMLVLSKRITIKKVQNAK